MLQAKLDLTSVMLFVVWFYTQSFNVEELEVCAKDIIKINQTHNSLQAKNYETNFGLNEL